MESQKKQLVKKEVSFLIKIKEDFLAVKYTILTKNRIVYEGWFG